MAADICLVQGERRFREGRMVACLWGVGETLLVADLAGGGIERWNGSVADNVYRRLDGLLSLPRRVASSESCRENEEAGELRYEACGE